MFVFCFWFFGVGNEGALDGDAIVGANVPVLMIATHARSPHIASTTFVRVTPDASPSLLLCPQTTAVPSLFCATHAFHPHIASTTFIILTPDVTPVERDK